MADQQSPSQQQEQISDCDVVGIFDLKIEKKKLASVLTKAAQNSLGELKESIQRLHDFLTQLDEDLRKAVELGFEAMSHQFASLKEDNQMLRREMKINFQALHNAVGSNEHAMDHDGEAQMRQKREAKIKKSEETKQREDLMYQKCMEQFRACLNRDSASSVAAASPSSSSKKRKDREGQVMVELKEEEEKEQEEEEEGEEKGQKGSKMLRSSEDDEQDKDDDEEVMMTK